MITTTQLDTVLQEEHLQNKNKKTLKHKKRVEVQNILAYTKYDHRNY